MVYALNSSGFQAAGLEDGKELFQTLEKGEAPCELILLDIMLPGMDGLEILKKIRKDSKYAALPVIMTTAKGSEYDKVVGLDLGADDYLAKPFGMMEMISRVKAVLRRSSSAPRSEILKAGNIELQLDEHKVYLNGKLLKLTKKEYDLLELFMKKPGRVYSRAQLLEKIWGADFVGETRTVDVHINTLRTKLEDDGKAIETVRGVGYRFEP
jgi:two-component system alkaline phosphatase synthesis response regulator PhoP